MKLNNILYTTLVGGAMLLLTGCAENNPVDKSTSVIKDNVVVENDFDKWLGAEFLKPYNIDVKYKFEDNEADRRYNLAPADYSKSVQLAHLLKYLGLEPYDEVTGSQAFIRQLFPKVVSFIGSAAYNTNGTIILGTAEGGRKMTLYRVNNLTTDNAEDLNEMYFHTIHHEFGHIQNQTKPYPVEFEQVSSKSYVSDSWNGAWDKPTNIRTTIATELRENSFPKVKEYTDYTTEMNSLATKISNSTATAAETTRYSTVRAQRTVLAATPEYTAQRAEYNKYTAFLNTLSVSNLNAMRGGFISAYASSQHGEDFVEIQAFYTTDSPEHWNMRMVFAGTEGRKIIEQKLAIVRTYLQSDWNIDLDKLRDNVLQRQANLSAQDLNSLTVK